jgi:serine/threonine protein kinase
LKPFNETEMINKTIGKHKIIRLIGRGGMATVYLAEHQLLYTQVAIKVLNDEFVRNTNIRNRFLSEARKMARMNHPNIIKVTDLIEEGDTVAFVMEYIEGETLKEYLDHKGKLDDAEIKNLFSQMLDALDYVHEQNLVHRDIKPSNFMLDKKGKVKLMDFGIAKTTDASSAEYTQTGTGIQMGTPMYMSPEQITETKSVTAQSDIYSLGVVLWQMVMGQKPYDIKTLSSFQLQTKIVNEPLIPTSTFWDRIIHNATAKDVVQRFRSCYEINKLVALIDKQEESVVAEKTILLSNKEETVIDFQYNIPRSIQVTQKKDLNLNYKIVVEEIAAAMVTIPSGEFMMGCSKGDEANCRDDEKPAHLVYLDSFSISKFEVTQVQWLTIMGNNPSHFNNFNKYANCPVENVSWEDIQQFIQKLNNITCLSYRLPSEAEWEYAARGAQNNQVAGSNQLIKVAWFRENSEETTHPVGQKEPNEFGLYDMNGNVWEWCADWYGTYREESQTNPTGPTFGKYRVNRGGGWFNGGNGCRISLRGFSASSFRSKGIGFRLASNI